MVKKFILSLSLISIIAPVHGMWSGFSRGVSRITQAVRTASVVAQSTAARKVVPLTPSIQVAKPSVPVAFNRSLPAEQAEKFKNYVQYVCGGGLGKLPEELRVAPPGRSVQEIADYCLKLTDEEMHHFIDSFAEHGESFFMQDIFEELCKKEALPWSPSIKHMVAHSSPYIARHVAIHGEDPPEVQELANKLIDYSLEEEKKGNIVFYHAQGWQWQFFEYLNRELYELVGESLPEDHTALRFKNASPLNFEEQKELAQRGIRQGDGFDWDRWNGLFCNMGVYACAHGSNSVDYFRDNYDQSTKQNRNIQQEADLFESFGKAALFKKIQDSPLFKELAQLHSESSKYGNFVTISLPKALAKEIVYPTISGGPRIEQPNEFYTEDGSHGPQVFKCAVETAENAHKTRFETKFVLVLGKNIIDPKEAGKAGVKVRSWNLADEKKLTLFKKVVRHLIHNIDDLEERQRLEDEITLLRYSICDFYKDLPRFKELIDRGLLDINTIFNGNKTVLQHAILINDIESVKQLLDWGADVNKSMRSAFYANNKELVELLLQHGADANEWIWTAVSNENDQMIELLLKYGADPERAMGTAIDNSNKELVELLLKYGADPEKGLIRAGIKDNKELVDLFIKHGADPEKRLLSTLKICAWYLKWCRKLS